MKYLTLYDKTKTYMFPNGAIATPEVMAEQYPATHHFPFVMETDINEQIIYSLDNLSGLRTMNNIDPFIDDYNAVIQLEIIANTVSEPEPTAEERLASALEYQNLLAM